MLDLNLTIYHCYGKKKTTMKVLIKLQNHISASRAESPTASPKLPCNQPHISSLPRYGHSNCCCYFKLQLKSPCLPLFCKLWI